MRSLRLTRRGTGFLVVAGVAFVAAPAASLPVLQRVTGLMTGLLVLAVAFVLATQPRTHVRRVVSPPSLRPGTPSRVTVVLRNLGRLPSASARWRDALPSAVVGDAEGRLPGIGGGDEVEVEHVVHGVRRGRHAIGPLLLEVEDPFGLVVRRRTVGEPSEVTVLPRVVDLHDGGPPVPEREGAVRPDPRPAGVGPDDVVARTYQPGDALKRVHWKATAHRGELMVRQEEQESDSHVTVVLDTDAFSLGTARDGHGRWEVSTDLEWLVCAAASLTNHLAHRGHDLTVTALDGFERRLGEQGDQVEDVLVDLAVLEPQVAPELVDPTRGGVGPGTSVVLLLGSIEPDRARDWVGSLEDADVVVLAARSSRPEALTVLDAAGWSVRTYGSGDGVADVWGGLPSGGRRAAT
ncbi:DUF58 domain-containing protein [Aeromicrobium halocynthiae]|uniref:DUF58 domain-containing protein n=1 Tax=Aeromicrobium halocynthiae TaxID=560557 RepID=A0ABN2VXI6_9ACTN